MALTPSQKIAVQNVIKTCLRKKFHGYKPESNNMPFHFRLLGRDRMALFSFVHSLNTTFGTSIFEPVAVELAKSRFAMAAAQYPVGNAISKLAQEEIQQIINELTMGQTPDKPSEIERIKAVCQTGQVNSLKTVKVDLFVQDKNGNLFFFDLKTAKPNISNFKDFKRTLLEWTAIALKAQPKSNIQTLIAIPYNPYEPKPYERWTLKGMLDLEHELKVAEEFWDFLGGTGAYQDLLDCFETAGQELRGEIDSYFAKF